MDSIDHTQNNATDGGGETVALQEAIGLFFQGIRDLDYRLIGTVFHPQANSFSLTSRGICIEPAEAWPRIIRQAQEDQNHLFRESFEARIVQLDVVGCAGMAKVEWIFKSAKIVDFYNLLKVEGNWLIVNQVYHMLVI